MADGPYAVRRANPRFSFFADAEVTLRDGTGVRAKTCELHGKVLYMHSGGGFGIFGMGVLFEEMGAEQHSAIDTWLSGLAKRPGRDSGKNPFSQSSR